MDDPRPREEKPEDTGADLDNEIMGVEEDGNGSGAIQSEQRIYYKFNGYEI